MTRSTHIKGAWTFVRDKAAKHSVFLAVLGILVSIALLTNKDLRAQIGTGPTVASRPDPSHSCTSEGTLFEGVTNLEDAADIFQQNASDIVEERLKLLQTPSEWKCPKNANEPADGPMPKLQALAQRLPGWSYELQSPSGFGTVREPKPVRFELFSSILMEFEREYECHLTQLQDDAIQIVVQHQDYPRGTQFCCAQDTCKVADTGVACDGAPSTDPFCNQACTSYMTSADAVDRLGPYYQRTTEERTRARVAVERTIMTLRSFEVNYGYTRDLMCYARASLDLRNELNLLADATSCMPKIWDALTSLHDRK